MSYVQEKRGNRRVKRIGNRDRHREMWKRNNRFLIASRKNIASFMIAAT